MTLEQLETILTIAETGSFRAAAEKLNRSQPALSAAVKNLEEEFDLQIFDRSSYRPTLTEPGATFLEAARSAFQSAQLTARIGRELGTKAAETKLRVSIDPLASTEFIEILANECAKPFVPVSLILEKSILSSSLGKLESGELDLAIAPRPEKTKDFEILNLETVVMKGALSKKRLKSQKKISHEAIQKLLQELPQIFAYDRTPNSEIPAQQKSIFVPDHATKVKLIAAGLGWGRICENEFHDHKDLITLDSSVMKPLSLEMSLIRSKTKPLGPVARAAWSAFKASRY